MVPGLAYGQTAAHPADSSYEHLGRWSSAQRPPRSTFANPAASSGATARNPSSEGAIERRPIWAPGGALIPPSRSFGPIRRRPTRIRQTLLPEIHNGIANAVSRSADQQTQQGDQQAPARVHQTRRRCSDSRRIRRFREYISNHEHAEQHRHQFRRHTFQQHSSRTSTEFRSTAQFSRLNFKIEDNFRGADLLGYVEGDFSGNSAPNVYQSVNGLTNRLRLYFGYAKRGKWEVLGGQTWSWLTPNRNGIGPMPSDLAITYNEDQNLAVGVPTRGRPSFASLTTSMSIGPWA